MSLDNSTLPPTPVTISTGGWRDAARLLAQIVSRCDLLQMEALDAGSRPLGEGIGRLGKHAMEASRQISSLDESPQAAERFNQSVLSLLELLDAVQQLSGSSAGVLRGEDLLSLQIAALELKVLAQPDSRHTAEEAAIPRSETPRFRVMIVDDDEGNRDILARILRSEPWDLELVASGVEALALAQSQDFDLIMLDVLMPGMDGLAVLRRLRHDGHVRQIPVIMISGVDQTANVVACLEMGAVDYVSKPFNPVLLRARIQTALEHRRMVLLEHSRMEKLEVVLAELDETRLAQDRLIEAMLPGWASSELKAKGFVAPRYHNDVSVVFTDFAGFTASCSTLTAYELVEALNEYFTAFDDIVAKYGLERLKTVGDAYMCVAGLSSDTPSNPNDSVLAAIEMLQFVESRSQHYPSWQMRVGINTGPVVSGVVGNQRLAFDIWGDTVNLAARVVAAGCPGWMTISEKTFQRVKEFFPCRARGALPIKGDRSLEMFFVDSPCLQGDGLSIEEREYKFRQRYRTYFGYELASIPHTLFCPSSSVSRAIADRISPEPLLARSEFSGGEAS